MWVVLFVRVTVGQGKQDQESGIIKELSRNLIYVMEIKEKLGNVISRIHWSPHMLECLTYTYARVVLIYKQDC